MSHSEMSLHPLSDYNGAFICISKVLWGRWKVWINDRRSLNIFISVIKNNTMKSLKQNCFMYDKINLILVMIGVLYCLIVTNNEQL